MTDKTFKPVLVVWLDAHVTSNEHWVWADDFKPDEGQMCWSVGYLFHKDKASVVLCQSIGGGSIDNMLTIPMGCVVEIKELIQPRSRRAR